jgi:ribosomal protein S13
MFKFGDRVLRSDSVLPMALSKIYGVGFQRGRYVCSVCGLSRFFRLCFLSVFLFSFLCFVLREFYVLETNLVRRISIYMHL